MEKYTASQIKYLLAIKKIDEKAEEIRSLDIANILGVAKSSVHKMLDTLKDMGLINKRNYGKIFLTENGRKLAEKYEYYFYTVEKEISPVIKNGDETKNAIFAFLSEISLETLNIVE